MIMIVGAMFVGWAVFEIIGRQHDPAKPYSVIDLAIFGGGAAAAIILLLIGFRVAAGGFAAPAVVIPENDRKLLEQLIRDQNEKGIDQYVRLSSLGGAAGTATQLGLTGLPLATIGLTVFFSALAVMKVDGFLDLAKLTLGAFIGSFVQRNVSGERAAAPPKDQPP
ncbi:MAG: hypothetical protein ABSC06_06650 [Rhodopila sp.]